MAFDLTLLIALAPALATTAAVLVVALLLRKLLYGWLGGLTKKSRTSTDDLLVGSTRSASFLWCFLAAIYVAVKAFQVPADWSDPVNKLLASLLIASVALAVASFCGRLVKWQASRIRVSIEITSLVQNVVRGIILLLGALILLDTLGVKVTSLIAALGIGSLAVALALQDTLSNVFAGMYIILSRNIRAGDYIKIDSGDEGYVVDIGWRATTIKPFQNTIVIVPNAKLSQSIVTNYSLPEPWIQVAIPINVSYGTDIELMERVLVEEGKQALAEVPGMLTSFEPVVRFMPGFGEYALNFVFVFRVKEFVDQYYVQHELRKRILKRFRREGIEFLPVRTIRVDGRGKAKSEAFEVKPDDFGLKDIG